MLRGDESEERLDLYLTLGILSWVAGWWGPLPVTGLRMCCEYVGVCVRAGRCAFACVSERERGKTWMIDIMRHWLALRSGVWAG
jgi:hypothetical protein